MEPVLADTPRLPLDVHSPTMMVTVPDESASRAIPSRLGSYFLREQIGKGGMGTVIKGWDENLDRAVALKLISREWAGDEECVARLRREARSAARLTHQNIVSVYAFGHEKGWPYIVMEYINGVDLGRYIGVEGPLAVDEAVRIAGEVAEGLAFAAKQDIVHRDIKPSNILLTPEGGVKILDFGLAKQMNASMTISSQGRIIGTPHYMSPEQGKGEPVDFRTDMYSLGLTLYSMLTARLPFDATTPYGIIMKQVQESLSIPEEWNEVAGGMLVSVLHKLTEKNPADRYPSWNAALEELRLLQEYLVSPPPLPKTERALSTPGRRRSWLKKSALAVACSFIAVLLLAAIGGRDSEATEEAVYTAPVIEERPLVNLAQQAAGFARGFHDLRQALTDGRIATAQEVVSNRLSEQEIQGAPMVQRRMETMLADLELSLDAAVAFDKALLGTAGIEKPTREQHLAIVEEYLKNAINGGLPPGDLLRGINLLFLLDSPYARDWDEFLAEQNSEYRELEERKVLASVERFHSVSRETARPERGPRFRSQQ